MPLLTMKQIMADSVKLATTDVDPKERYAVGAFNCLSLENVMGVIAAAEELHRLHPRQLAEGEHHAVIGQGEGQAGQRAVGFGKPHPQTARVLRIPGPAL